MSPIQMTLLIREEVTFNKLLPIVTIIVKPIILSKNQHGFRLRLWQAWWQRQGIGAMYRTLRLFWSEKRNKFVCKALVR
jgi:hypothetical protein